MVVSTVPSTLRAFLLPYAEHFRRLGWEVDAATGRGTVPPAVTAGFDQVHQLPWARSLNQASLAAAAADVRRLLPGYDLVHTHTPVASFVTRMAALTVAPSHRPVLVYTAHGFHFHAGGSRRTNALYTAAEWLAGRATDRLVVLTEADERAARRRHLVPVERLTHLPGVGIDLAHYAPTVDLLARSAQVRGELGVPADAPLFTVVAAMDPGKNHVAALRALALVPEAHLACAGDGPERARLESLAARLQLGERLHLLGSVQDVRPLVLASTATVLPSRREGLSRSVLESLALGVPVLGSRVRGIQELVPPAAGLLVEPDDVAGLAAAMRQAVEFPAPAALRALLADHLAPYSIDGLLGAHEELYQEALGARRRATPRTHAG